MRSQKSFLRHPGEESGPPGGWNIPGWVWGTLGVRGMGNPHPKGDGNPQKWGIYPEVGLGSGVLRQGCPFPGVTFPVSFGIRIFGTGGVPDPVSHSQLSLGTRIFEIGGVPFPVVTQSRDRISRFLGHGVSHSRCPIPSCHSIPGSQPRSRQAGAAPAVSPSLGTSRPRKCPGAQPRAGFQDFGMIP